MKTLAVFFLFIVTACNVYGQGIFTGINNKEINVSCLQSCPALNFKIPHLKSDEEYQVVDIPYTPYAYTTPAGNELTTLYADDKYSSIIKLPFPICFYGAVYDQIVVGSNGLVTFDISNAASPTCVDAAYKVIPQIPNSGGGAQCQLEAVYYPRAAIMGLFCDLNPQATASPAGRKIEWRVEGTLPFRRFVASWYKVGVYTTNGNSCSMATPTTFQIVVNEATSVIEVFIEQKQCYDQSQAVAILGIQNWDWTKGLAAPRKNARLWTANNEGHRFIPSGANSRFLSSEIFDMAGNFIKRADTITTTPGLLDLDFQNAVCAPIGSTKYRVVTTFASCNGTGPIVLSDTITINRDPNIAPTAVTTTTSCGAPSGSITVTVPGSNATNDFIFTLNGTTSKTGTSPMLFDNLAEGNYTIDVASVTPGGCTSTLNNIKINLVNNLTAVATPVASACPGVDNGAVNVAAPVNGSGSYDFVLTPGGTIITGATANFTGLAPGNYTVTVTDKMSNCTVTTASVAVATGSGIIASATPSGTSCNGATDGSVVITVNNGTAPFRYSLDGGAPSATFSSPITLTGLNAGAHTIKVTDAAGCETVTAIGFSIAAGPALAFAPGVLAPTCNTAANGSIIVTHGGTGTFSYVLNGGTPQSSNTFPGLISGTYTVQYFNTTTGCSSDMVSVTIPPGLPITTTATHTNVLCNGGNSGSITVTQPVNGTAPFEYSLDNINWQTANMFTGLTAGSYTVYYKEANGCKNQLTQVITQPALLTTTLSSTSVLCNGASNGTITVQATGGTTPYDYSIDGGLNWQTTNVFTVAANTHSIITRDANQCTSTQSIAVAEPAVLTATNTVAPATCNGGNDGTITVSAAGGNLPYTYSLDGGITTQSSNIFKLVPGNYTVTVKDNKGCITTTNGVVGLINDLVYTAQAVPFTCEGVAVQLNVNSNATQYSWSPATGLSNPAIANPLATPSATTTYTVTVTYGNCSADLPVTVNIYPAPIANAGLPGAICFGQSFQLQGSGGVQYAWSPAASLDNPSISNPTALPDRTTTYSLVVTDANNCRSIVPATVVVDVTPPIKVSIFPSDTVLHEGAQFQLNAVAAADHFTWTPVSGLNTASVSNPVFTAGVAGDVVLYKVVASTDAGCKGEGYARVQVYKGPELYTATGFTPNGDGRNDLFFPFPVGIKSIRYFRVFNRWGKLLFSTSKLNDGWNGQSGGRDQPGGVYVWMVEGVTLDNQVITKKGTVMLIR